MNIYRVYLLRVSIVKIFPDRSLSQIVTHTKTCYNEDAYKGQWKPEQDEELLEYVI